MTCDVGDLFKKHTDVIVSDNDCRERELRMKWILFYAYTIMCTATMGDDIITLMLVPSTTHMSTWRDNILYCPKIFYLWVINGVVTYCVTPLPPHSLAVFMPLCQFTHASYSSTIMLQLYEWWVMGNPLKVGVIT